MANNEIIETLLTKKEAASFLRVSLRTINRRIKDGSLKGAMVGTWKISKSDLIAFYEQSKINKENP